MRAKRFGLPVVAIAGTIGDGARVNYEVGIDAFTCILQRPGTLEEAVGEAGRLVREGAEGVMRLVGVGGMVGERIKDRHCGSGESLVRVSGELRQGLPQVVTKSSGSVMPAVSKCRGWLGLRGLWGHEGRGLGNCRSIESTEGK